jgi:hypothetical protein
MSMSETHPTPKENDCSVTKKNEENAQQIQDGENSGTQVAQIGLQDGEKGIRTKVPSSPKMVEPPVQHSQVVELLQPVLLNRDTVTKELILSVDPK